MGECPYTSQFSPIPHILQPLSPTPSKSIPMYVILVHLIHVSQVPFLPWQGLYILIQVMMRLATSYCSRIIEERWGLNFKDKYYLARNLPYCFLLNSESHLCSEFPLSPSVLDREVNLIPQDSTLKSNQFIFDLLDQDHKKLISRYSPFSCWYMLTNSCSFGVGKLFPSLSSPSCPQMGYVGI